MLAAGFEITPLTIGTSLCLFLVASYIHTIIEYKRARAVIGTGKLAPQYPLLLSYLECIACILWDSPGFLRRVTSYCGERVSSRICLIPGLDVHIFQDSETIREIWRNSAKMSTQQVHVYAIKYMFGMPEEIVQLYRADTSGPLPEPRPGSNVLPEHRVHRILNEGTSAGLTGKGLEPLLQRVRKTLIARIRERGPPNHEWMEISDFRKFIHNTLGYSLVEAIFGPSLLSINPEFMDDLYKFNGAIPWLSKGLPYFLIPGAYKIRRKLHQNFRQWYHYARTHFTESSIYEDGDGDPFWGSAWMRQRQKARQGIRDEDASASIDLGVAWASIENITVASSLALTHISKIPNLATRIRQELESDFGQESLQEINLRKLSNSALLSSVYAETLRLHVKSFTVISSPYTDLNLGQYLLPKGSLGLVNSDITHMCNNSWNTKGGSQPVRTFWADRFLVDPPPDSGVSESSPGQPLSAGIREPDEVKVMERKPYFSIEGLEATWIPFGGGQLKCPGRFLAKYLMIFLCALIVQEFDIDVRNDKLQFSTGWYGFGTEVPKRPIQVRMRRKE
ncbi:cytochrome P450 [Xylaria cf. heliscus]|nr:cytochrome P450 [Xylaria cf. heliscus]